MSEESSRIAAELRAAIKTMRRTPVPLEDFIPLFLKAADEIERLSEYEWMYKGLCE